MKKKLIGREKDVVNLHFFEGYSYREIAHYYTSLGMPVTIKVIWRIINQEIQKRETSRLDTDKYSRISFLATITPPAISKALEKIKYK